MMTFNSHRYDQDTNITKKKKKMGENCIESERKEADFVIIPTP